MKEITLFEIPIYSISEEKFYKYWNTKKDRLIKEWISHGHTVESAKEGFSAIYYPQSVWRYNKIVGFIVISITSDDVVFYVYRSLDKKFYCETKQKRFIIDTMQLGLHFRTVHKSSASIKDEILDWLKDIEKELPKRFYVDYSTFNNIFHFIDIIEIIKTQF